METERDDGPLMRDGVRWTDEQQRLGWVYGMRTLLAIAAIIAGCALARSWQ